MPTQLPLESTDLFGDLLFPHTFDILQSDATKPLESQNFSIPIQSVCNIQVFGHFYMKLFVLFSENFDLQCLSLEYSS